MGVKAALYSLLAADAGVKALVDDRIYPLTIPQDKALPAIAYQVITTTRGYNHAGQSSLAGPYFQITIAAASAAAAEGLAAAVRLALSGYAGTVGTVVIASIFLENEFDGYSLETAIATVRQDYRITYKEV